MLGSVGHGKVLYPAVGTISIIIMVSSTRIRVIAEAMPIDEDSKRLALL